MAKKSTPEQLFRIIFNTWLDENAPQETRDVAGRKMKAWLQRHGKNRIDISSILHQAEKDDEAAKPAPPPPDPRAGAPHPFDDPRFNPADVVEHVVSKYLTMKPHVLVIYVLWIIFTHVYTKFRTAPRIALISEEENSGKTTALDVARCLVLRPNEEALGTVAAIRDFLDQGPGTLLLDELDLVVAEVRKALLLLWNLGHKRGARYSLKVGKERRLVPLHAPVMAAGIGGDFLGRTQVSRTFKLWMERYTEETKPEREFDEEDAETREDLNAVYRYLCHFASKVKLDLKPPMPQRVLARAADDLRGMLAIADACGPKWAQRAREAFAIALEEAKAELPQVVILRHGLTIFDRLELDRIDIHRFDRELLRLDMPGMDWSRYRGPGGMSPTQPIRPGERAALLKKVGIESVACWPPGPRQAGVRSFRAQFEEALRRHESRADMGSASGRLRLVAPSSD